MSADLIVGCPRHGETYTEPCGMCHLYRHHAWYKTAWSRPRPRRKPPDKSRGGKTALPVVRPPCTE